MGSRVKRESSTYRKGVILDYRKRKLLERPGKSAPRIYYGKHLIASLFREIIEISEHQVPGLSRKQCPHSK